MSVLQAYLAGKEARRVQDAEDRTNMFRQYMGNNAQAIMSGDQGAMQGAYSIDPMMAMEVQGFADQSQQRAAAERRAASSEARAAEAHQLRLAEWAEGRDKEELAAEAESLRRSLEAAAAINSPEEWDAAAAADEATQAFVGQFDRKEQILSMLGSSADYIEQLAGPDEDPMSTIGKLRADLDAGRITEEDFLNATKDKGMVIESDGQGGFRMVQGADVSGLGKAGRNELDKREIGARDALARLDRIQTNLDTNPELLDAQSLTGRLKTEGLSWKDFITGGDLTEDQAQYLADVTTMRGDILENVNYTIKEITGAAMTEPEAKRIGATLPGVEDGPTVFKAKLERALEAARMAVARYNYWRKSGLEGNPWDVGTLSDMKGIIQDRAREIWQEEVASGEPSTARERARARLVEEFGEGFGG